MNRLKKIIKRKMQKESTMIEGPLAGDRLARSDNMIDREPTPLELAKVSAQLKTLNNSPTKTKSSEVIEFLWARHNYPSPSDDRSHVSVRSTVLNRYRFDLERLSTDAFWAIFRYLDLD